MTENPLSLSVVINAPVEHVWSLLIEQQQSYGQQMIEQKYLSLLREPQGPPVAGQVIHVKAWFLHLTASIDHVVQAESPLTGQTISARVSFLGKDGKSVSHWFRDPEHYHIQTQATVKHPWCTITEQTEIRCITMDTTSCVIVYRKQSEMTFRLVPRWLAQRLDNDSTVRKATTRAVEASLQGIKAKAEQNVNQIK